MQKLAHYDNKAIIVLRSWGCSVASVAWLVGASAYAPKGCRPDSWLGHIPRLGFSPGYGHLWEATNQCFSLSLSLPLPLSLRLVDVSSLGKDLKKNMVVNDDTIRVLN